MKIHEMLDPYEIDQLSSDLDMDFEEIQELEITDVVQDHIDQFRNEDESARMVRNGELSDQIMTIADEVQKELDEEFASECDETYREAA